MNAEIVPRPKHYWEWPNSHIKLYLNSSFSSSLISLGIPSFEIDRKI